MFQQPQLLDGLSLRENVLLPAICFADEPTGALDSTSADAVLEILGRLNQDGLTIVMVTHDHDVAAHADRVIRVVDGRVDAATRRLPGDAT